MYLCHRGQKKWASDPLELELELVCSGNRIQVPLQEQEVCLTPVPSLQPCVCFSCMGR